MVDFRGFGKTQKVLGWRKSDRWKKKKGCQDGIPRLTWPHRHYQQSCYPVLNNFLRHSENTTKRWERIWCLRLCPLSGFWSCEVTPGSGHLTLTDRSLVSIQKRLPSPVPRGFPKVTLLEKFSFVLIAIIQYFKLSSKQILNVYFDKFFIFKSPSNCKTRLKSNSTMKVGGFFTGHWSDLRRHVEQML